MEEESWSRRWLEVGGTIFICNDFWAGYVLIHHTSLTLPPPAPWDVINDRSLM